LSLRVVGWIALARRHPWVLLWRSLSWIPRRVVVVRRREPAVPILGAACEAVPRVLAVILRAWRWSPGTSLPLLLGLGLHLGQDWGWIYASALKVALKG